MTREELKADIMQNVNVFVENYIDSVIARNQITWFDKEPEPIAKPFAGIHLAQDNISGYEVVRNKPSRWKPDMGGTYFCINYFGEILEGYFHKIHQDEQAWQFGNCFPTKELAEEARDRIKKLLMEL